MKSVPDAVIVGGGPCGSYAALKLAQRGFKVTVFEEHKQVGFPSHCAGHISIKGLADLGLLPLPREVVENAFSAACFHSPKGNSFSVRFQSPVTYAVDRALFDKQLADRAVDAGAEYCFSSRVKSLLVEKGFVRGVVVESDGRIERNEAGIVLDAEGVASRLRKQIGLEGFDQRMIVNGVEAEVDNVRNVETDVVDVYLGEQYSPGLYGWLIPKKDGKAKVGLGARNGNPGQLLRKLMTKHPAASKKLQNAKILQISFHPLTLGGPLKEICSNGFLAVGDAASQVKPTTGGGVVLGLTCTDIAVEVVHEALDRNDVSASFLEAYQTRCDKAVGFDVRIMLGMRKRLDMIPDRRLDDMIAMCKRLALDKILQKSKDIDFQGRTFLHALGSPRILAALGYFFLIYLSSEPLKRPNR